MTLTAWQASQQFVQHPATTADPQLSRPSKPVTAYPPQQCYDAISSVEQTAANGCQGTCPPSGDGQAPTSQQHTVHQDTAQVNLPTHQQQEWQQDERQQREQQQWQQDEQQQQLQQHLERLLSNAEASTSSCAAAAAGDVYDTSTSPRSSTTRGTLTSHVRAQVEGSISSSHADNTTSVPVQRQQKVQVHPNSHATYVNHSSSSSSSITSSESSSNGTSSTKQVQGRQLVRPMQGMPSPGGELSLLHEFA